MTEDRRSSGRPAPVMLSGSALALGLVALVAEIVLFAAIGQLAHHHAGGGVTGIVVAVVVLALAAVLWGVFMAPNSPRRISLRPRVGVCGVLGLVLGGLLVAAGWNVWGVVVGVCGLGLAAVQWVMGRAQERAEAARTEAARTDCFPGDPS